MAPRLALIWTTPLRREPSPLDLADGWGFRGTGDFNLDGFQDILWSNTGTGAISFWYINNARFGAAVYLPTVPDVAWEIEGIDNFGTN